jgi:hypothetical protein
LNEALRQTLRVTTASIRAFDGGMFGSQGGSCDPFTQIDAGGNPAS